MPWKQILFLKYPTLLLIVKIWKVVKALLGYQGFTEYSPLLDNKHLHELHSIGKMKECENGDINCLAQTYEYMTLKSFQELRKEYAIPNQSFYRYLKDRHALRMQFKEKTLGWNEIPLLLEVVSASSSKGLISDLYVNICKAAVEGVEDLRRSSEGMYWT